MFVIIICLIGMLFTQNISTDKRIKACRMEATIGQCEETIDSLENVISFMDTVGETDEYSDLQDCYDHFKREKDVKAKSIYYNQYMKHYHKVMHMAVEQIRKKAVYEYEESLPVHTCGGE